MKRIVLLLVAMCIIPGLASCGNKEGLIGREAAEERALSHAGVSAKEASFVRVETELDDGRRIYEVEFYTPDAEYDYEIDAVTGEILSFDSDVEGFSLPAEGNPGAASETNSAAQIPGETNLSSITEEEALNIALGLVPGATAEDARVRKDYDDGKIKYDVTIIYDNTEYDFEIDAATGEVMERDADSVFDD